MGEAAKSRCQDLDKEDPAVLRTTLEQQQKLTEQLTKQLEVQGQQLQQLQEQVEQLLKTQQQQLLQQQQQQQQQKMSPAGDSPLEMLKRLDNEPWMDDKKTVCHYKVDGLDKTYRVNRRYDSVGPNTVTDA